MGNGRCRPTMMVPDPQSMAGAHCCAALQERHCKDKHEELLAAGFRACELLQHSWTMLSHVQLWACPQQRTSLCFTSLQEAPTADILLPILGWYSCTIVWWTQTFSFHKNHFWNRFHFRIFSRWAQGTNWMKSVLLCCFGKGPFVSPATRLIYQSGPSTYASAVSQKELVWSFSLTLCLTCARGLCNELPLSGKAADWATTRAGSWDFFQANTAG